jgi:hypothetical protein
MVNHRDTGKNQPAANNDRSHAWHHGKKRLHILAACIAIIGESGYFHVN